jgi:hypothetical protein
MHPCEMGLGAGAEAWRERFGNKMQMKAKAPLENLLGEYEVHESRPVSHVGATKCTCLHATSGR